MVGDLNRDGALFGVSPSGDAHEHRQAPFFAQLMDFLRFGRPFTRVARARLLAAKIPSGSVEPGSCAEGYRSMVLAKLLLPGKPARHRDRPLGPGIETLSHGLRAQPLRRSTLDDDRRQARLAYPSSAVSRRGSVSPLRRSLKPLDESLCIVTEQYRRTRRTWRSIAPQACRGFQPGRIFRSTKAFAIP